MMPVGMNVRENYFGYHRWESMTREWEFPIGPVDPWEEAISDDLERFPMVHIHVSQYGRDCDGGHGYDYIKWPDERDNYTAEDVSHHVESERASLPGTFSVDKFWRKAVMSAMAFYTSGKLETEIGEDTYDRAAHWGNATDEGFSSEEIRMCTDTSCKDTRPEVYDQFARMAGY
jgi:hypothetical protein